MRLDARRRARCERGFNVTWSWSALFAACVTFTWAWFQQSHNLEHAEFS